MPNTQRPYTRETHAVEPRTETPVPMVYTPLTALKTPTSAMPRAIYNYPNTEPEQLPRRDPFRSDLYADYVEYPKAKTASVHPKTLKALASHHTGGSSALDRVPASPPAGPPPVGYDPIRELTPEERAFRELCDECKRLNKDIPGSVAEALKRATAWAGDSARLARLASDVEELGSLLTRALEKQQSVSSLIWRRPPLPSSPERPAKRRRSLG